LAWAARQNTPLAREDGAIVRATERQDQHYAALDAAYNKRAGALGQLDEMQARKQARWQADGAARALRAKK
jgi:hypothetical protein